MNKKNINNIANFAVKFSEEVANKECLTVDDISLNFNQFSVLVTSYAKKLKKLNLNKGDRVGILLFNSIEYLLLMYASMYAGFVPVNINARYKAKELNYVLHDSKCKILFTSSQSDEVTNFSEIISSVYDSKEGQPEELIDVYIIGGSKDNRFKDFKEFESIFVDDSLNEEATGSEDDPAFIMYTSGTTSNPKGCPLSHKNVLHVANSMVDRWKMNDKDVFWDPLPMFHMSSILPFIGCSISK